MAGRKAAFLSWLRFPKDSLCPQRREEQPWRWPEGSGSEKPVSALMVARADPGPPRLGLWKHTGSQEVSKWLFCPRLGDRGQGTENSCSYFYSLTGDMGALRAGRHLNGSHIAVCGNHQNMTQIRGRDLLRLETQFPHWKTGHHCNADVVELAGGEENMGTQSGRGLDLLSQSMEQGWVLQRLPKPKLGSGRSLPLKRKIKTRHLFPAGAIWGSGSFGANQSKCL